MGTDTFTAITLAPGRGRRPTTFGELLPASLAGFVYVDANNDGDKEAGEAGIKMSASR